jgi:hypothetical protein
MSTEQNIQDAEFHVQNARHSLEAAEVKLKAAKDNTPPTEPRWWVGSIELYAGEIRFTPLKPIKKGTELGDQHTIETYGVTGHSCIIIRGTFTRGTPVKIGI